MRINWINKRIRRIIDRTLDRILLRLIVLEELVDDGDRCVVFGGAGGSKMLLWRRLEAIKVRLMITEQIVAVAKIMISGKIRRNIRIASALSSLELNLFSSSDDFPYGDGFTFLNQNNREFQWAQYLKIVMIETIEVMRIR